MNRPAIKETTTCAICLRNLFNTITGPIYFDCCKVHVDTICNKKYCVSRCKKTNSLIWCCVLCGQRKLLVPTCVEKTETNPTGRVNVYRPPLTRSHRLAFILAVTNERLQTFVSSMRNFPTQRARKVLALGQYEIQAVVERDCKDTLTSLAELERSMHYRIRAHAELKKQSFKHTYLPTVEKDLAKSLSYAINIRKNLSNISGTTSVRDSATDNQRHLVTFYALRASEILLECAQATADNLNNYSVMRLMIAGVKCESVAGLCALIVEHVHSERDVNDLQRIAELQLKNNSNSIASSESSLSDGYQDRVGAMICLPGEELAASMSDGIITVWNVHGDSFSQRLELVGHRDSVTCLWYSLSEQLLFSGSLDETVRIWTITSHACCLYTYAHYGAVFMVRSLGLNENGMHQLLCATRFKLQLRLYDPDLAMMRHLITADSMFDTVECVEILTPSAAKSGAARLLAACGNDVCVYRLETLELLFKLREHQARVTGLHVLPKLQGHTGRLLLSISLDQSICVWDWSTRTLMKRLTFPCKFAHSSLLGVNKMLTVDTLANLTVWDLSNPLDIDVVCSSQTHQQPVGALTVRGNRIYSFSEIDKVIQIIQVNSTSDSAIRRSPLRLRILNNFIF